MTNRFHALAEAIWFAGFLLLAPSLAVAGPNAGGTLMLHADPSLVYTTDTQSWCGQTSLAACSLAVTSVPWQSGTPIVFHAIAAFPPDSQPRLKALSFGIDYDPAKFVLAARGSCADFELPDGGWPAPGTGTAQSWTTATQTNLLTECYWFVGYAYSEQEGEDSTSVALIPHPVQHGVFVDDAFPAEVDTIAGYGRLGFGMAGAVPCPDGGGDVVWILDEPIGDNSEEPGEPGGDSEDPGEPPDADSPVPLGPEAMPTDQVSVWIDGDRVDLGAVGSSPLPIASVPFMDAAIRQVLVQTGVLSIQRQFPASSPSDTVVSDPYGYQVRVPALASFYLLKYPNATAAEAATPDLLELEGVRCANLKKAWPVMMDPVDPYFWDFPVRAPQCVPQYDPPCRANPQWFLQNWGTRSQSGRHCLNPVPGKDIQLPADYWPTGTDSWPWSWSILIGEVDTGVWDSHPDLKVWPLSTADRESLQTYPDHDWCGVHGTAMAGIEAATANDLGVVGVCSSCWILDVESSGCSESTCLAHQCGYVSAAGHIDKATRWQQRQQGNTPILAAFNLEFAALGSYASPDEVAEYWRAYSAGHPIVAPVADDGSVSVPRTCAPANVPFALGVGGHTHDGRLWDRNTTCYWIGTDSLRGTTVGPGLDICAPACPSYLTTWAENVDTTWVTPSGPISYDAPYWWTRGECSGASAAVAGAIGLLTDVWWNVCTDHIPHGWPVPSDYIGVIKATATPWPVNPASYSFCTYCDPGDYGWGG